MSALLSVEDLRKNYGERSVLRVDSFQLEEGKVTALVGPNGSGKSTFLRLINLLEKPTGGEIIFWDGSRLSSLGRRERRRLSREMAMIFQDPLPFRRTVRENLAYGLKVRRLGRAERAARVEEMLLRLGLREYADRSAHTLSGGEAQKMALGRAMILRPRLLLLDEPLTNLDLPSRRELLRLISELVRDDGVSVLYVSHDYHEVLEIADILAVLVEGELLQVGEPGEVFARPRTEKVASFLGSENLLEGVIERRMEEMGFIRIGKAVLAAVCDLPAGSRVKVLVHPEEVVLVPPGDEAGSARNRLAARVMEVRDTGSLVRVAMDCGFPLVAHVTRASREMMGIRPGSEFTAVMKATSLHVMPFTGRS